MVWSEDIRKTLEKGISLSNIGIDNWALSKDQAILAIDEFEKLKIPVLGGDVYEMVGGSLELIYDNWYCNQNVDEDLEHYVVRSTSRARNYIKGYNNPRGREVFFTLVPQ